jgi:hypothetical protein
VTGLEPLVVGYLVAWAAARARRLGERVNSHVDQALDKGVDRLAELVLGKIGADPSVAQLTADAEDGGPSARTVQRVELALEEAAEQDPTFAAELRALVAELAGPGLVITAVANDQATVYVQGSGTMYVYRPSRDGRDG